jgi:hypothetical protein
MKSQGKEILGGESRGVAFQRFGVRDFGNPEGKEQGHFGIGNPEVLKEAVVSELDFVCIFQAERVGRKYSDTHQFGIRGSLQRQAEEKQSIGTLW